MQDLPGKKAASIRNNAKILLPRLRGKSLAERQQVYSTLRLGLIGVVLNFAKSASEIIADRDALK